MREATINREYLCCSIMLFFFYFLLSDSDQLKRVKLRVKWNWNSSSWFCAVWSVHAQADRGHSRCYVLLETLFCFSTAVSHPKVFLCIGSQFKGSSIMYWCRRLWMPMMPSSWLHRIPQCACEGVCVFVRVCLHELWMVHCGRGSVCLLEVFPKLLMMI